MIKTRIAGTAALFTFGLAAIGGTALVVAAPGYADTGTSGSTSSSGSSSASTSGTTSTSTSASGTTSADPAKKVRSTSGSGIWIHGVGE